MSLKKTYNFLADSGVLVMAVFFLMYLKLFQSSILSRKQEETPTLGTEYSMRNF